MQQKQKQTAMHTDEEINTLKTQVMENVNIMQEKLKELQAKNVEVNNWNNDLHEKIEEIKLKNQQHIHELNTELEEAMKAATETLESSTTSHQAKMDEAKLKISTLESNIENRKNKDFDYLSQLNERVQAIIDGQ